MTEILKGYDRRYEELNLMLGDPKVLSDQEAYRKAAKEHAAIEGMVLAFREYAGLLKVLDDDRALLEEGGDAEMAALIKEEMDEVGPRAAALEGRLKALLTPRDPNDGRNVVMEIRAGAGGDEAALFCGVLYRMYFMHAEKSGWTVDVVNANETELGGYKEIVFTVEANGAYSRLKHESGVHRVQRVPATESSGRIHTSTVTVAV
ncbi:MAG: PCRF domain-containing protein, partial [Oscillospiraceae bacterium]|nr:PCRF domain-containing protein [Oscillospiraceae bacterium]